MLIADFCCASRVFHEKMIRSRHLIHSHINAVRSVLLANKCELKSNYCTNATEIHEVQPKTITEKFTESMNKMTELRRLGKLYHAKDYVGSKTLKPMDGYTPRFQYNGYVRKSHWHLFDENGPKKDKPEDKPVETELQYNYKIKKKHKYCILMGFAGGNYFGMQYNQQVNTIEDELLKAMVKNQWILEEHLQNPHFVEFMRGSRTDRGVSAARMNVSVVLPIDVNVDDLNRDLPSDIRVFGVKRVTPKFDARYSCSGRTYSYTLPTIAFAHYNDQTLMKDYRITSDRLQRANEILSLYKGQTNFHNFTDKKVFFDRSSQRRIDDIRCSEPFIESGIEFARITVAGESFMLHQIRRMVGFFLAVMREVVGDDLLRRSLTKEIFHTPTAPGLGLMLERLHFTQYANRFPDHDPLIFDEFDDQVEQFREEFIHPFIVQTEINEESMVQWLEYLCVHTFDAVSRAREENRRFHDDPQFGDEWGEDKEFIEKLDSRILRK